MGKSFVTVFVNNLDRESVRELEVEAGDEVSVIVKLDLYDYDETWQHYSFVDVRQKWGCIKSLFSRLFR